MALSVLMVTNNYPTTEAPHMGAATALQERGLRGLGVNVDIAFFDRIRYGRTVYKGMRERILCLANEKHSDIVHVQFGGISAYNAVQACGRRCVITFHGTDLHGGSPRNLVEKLSFGAGVLASKWAAAKSGWNIVVSPDLATRLSRITSRVSIIPTGVDYAAFRPIQKAEALAALGLNPQKKHVIFCDSMRAAVKRRDVAIAALEFVRSKGVDAELLELHCIPHIKIPLCLNAADCLLVTSDKEGSPNIVKEAIACNLPVVSVDVGDVPARIFGVSNCSIVPRDIVSIGSALHVILSGAKRANGRDMKSGEIENITVCRKILSVYQNLIAGTCPGGGHSI